MLGFTEVVSPFMLVDLIVWGAQLVLIPYFIFRKKHDHLCASVILLLVLLIPIFIGINTPNPDNIRLVPVALP